MSKFNFNVTSTAPLNGVWYSEQPTVQALNDGTDIYEYTSNEIHANVILDALIYAKAHLSDLSGTNSILSIQINKIF